MASRHTAAPLRRNVVLAFSVAVLVLVITGGASVWGALRSSDAARAWSASTRRRTAELQLLSWLQDAETGQRGYLITGLPTFLAPYDLAVDSIPAALSRLAGLTAGDTAASRHVAALRPLVAAKLGELGRTVALRRGGAGAAARQAVASGEGKALMDAIRGEIAAMLVLEDRGIAAWKARLDTAMGLALGMVGVAGVLAVVFLVGAGVVVHRDVGRRVRAERAAADIFALSPDLIVTADAGGHFRSVNPAWERQLGYTAEEMLAQPFLEFVHPDDRAATVAMYDAQKGGQAAESFVNRYRRKDGTYRWLEWNATPFEVDDLVHAVARDVTERRQAEAQVQALNAELARNVATLRVVNEELEAFSYSVSHDLRAPLRHIAGFAELLEKHVGEGLDERARRYVSTIRQAARRMAELIDDLLAFSRVGRAQLAVADVALDDVVRGALAELQGQCEGREVAFDVAPLPAVRGDRNLLHLVLTNLLSNAIKYTRPRARAEIEIGAAPPEDGRAVIFVRDNGVGFDMQYAGKLFGVFQRLHSADEFEGTGIGLANVQRIVHRLGGRTWAEGKVDGGATFFVALPAAGLAA